MLTKEDLSIIIATYNRPKDINRTLKCIKKNGNIPKYIFVIDQSIDNETRNIVKRYSKYFNVKYIFSSIPSSSIAKNIGIVKSKKVGAKLIYIVDDDVGLREGCLDKVIKEFNSHPEVMGVTAADVSEKNNFNSFFYRINKAFLRFFFLPIKENHKFRMLGPYGNTGSPIIKIPIRDAEWLPGFNMCYRSSVFSDYKLPESLGYNVLEDIDSSYYVFKKFGSGSLVILPSGLSYHRFSKKARYAEKKRIFVNHVDHFYFYYKYFKTPIGTLKLFWSIIGIILGNFIRFLFNPQKKNYFLLKYNLEAIFYSFKNREKIRNGKLREFLNKDLSMKEKYYSERPKFFPAVFLFSRI